MMHTFINPNRIPIGIPIFQAKKGKLPVGRMGRKAMTNLDSILKSRDITLPTNVHLVKAMAFPVVVYGHVNWTIKKAEHQRMDALKL